MNDLISVIVPVYNTERYLERCVSSIQMQTYRQLEIILVEDGSPDHAGALCDTLLAGDERIQVIHKRNGGASSARNVGMECAHGAYLAFVDSDDFLLDETIYERSIQNLQANKADIVAFLWQYRDTDGNYLVRKERTPSDFCGIKTTTEFAEYLYRDGYCNGLVVNIWNKLYRREFIKDLFFDDSVRAFEDEEWLNRVYSQQGKVFCDGTFGYTYAQNNASMTHQKFSNAYFSVLNSIRERANSFAKNPFIVAETKKLYLNLYIEYYFKAAEAGIQPYSDRCTYQAFLSSLTRRGGVELKTLLRFLLFLLSPRIYKILTKLGE